jgi:2-hydroxychromene-2-carboxylate isomerase
MTGVRRWTGFGPDDTSIDLEPSSSRPMPGLTAGETGGDVCNDRGVLRFQVALAYFAAHRIRKCQIGRGHHFVWRPVSIDVLLNLQAGREPWGPYVDPLPAAKRAHLVADVRRLAAYYDLLLRPTRPRRPNTIPALCLAKLLDERQRGRFGDAVFAALWQEQQDVSDPEVLNRCLDLAGCGHQLIDAALDDVARFDLAQDSVQAYARGIFGVPSFVVGDDMFFGHDRLDLLLWSIDQRARD